MRALRVFTGLALGCAALSAGAEDIPLNLVKLPDGFKISVYAQGMTGARSLARSEKGTLFVSTRGEDHIYAAQDKDGDGVLETIHTLGSGMNQPNGVAFRDGSLYVAEVTKISRYDAIDDHLDALPEPMVLVDNLPDQGGHTWKYLAIGPDDRMYFALGAPCNICGPDVLGDTFATIKSTKLDGTDLQLFAKGVRNSVGYAWHPVTKEMWFTENGRDMLGDDRPPCELNRATAPGQDFGYPFCHGGNDPDPEFTERGCEGTVAPAQNLGAHVAPLGLKFYTGDKFPAEYQNAIFIAEHGSWNRSIPQGYRITVVKLDEQGNSKGFEVFADGWLRRTKAWGRPVDILVLPDGSMLVSDDMLGAVYRIAYEAK